MEGSKPAQQRALGGGGETSGRKGRLGLAQEFWGKEFVLSLTGAGEPPAGRKRGVT